ncbi:MAG: glcNAc-PI de-N-acetylase family protein [Ilumatobacteraceae bacterium]|nr:glcNAc-PI de-N-acetylase family protein [Ilumatobacteraceae bacterium]
MRTGHGERVVVLSPHLDDAVLSAWSVLTLPPTVDVEVVVVFAGIPVSGTTGTFDPIFGTADSHGLAEQRRVEDREALARAGRTPVHLDLLDVQYRTQPLPVTDVAAAIAEPVAQAATVVVPAGIGRHPDHLLVRDAGADAARRTGARLVRYADLPYATNMGWPAWVTGADPDPTLVPDALWGALLDEVDGGAAAREAHVVTFTEAEQAAKLAALGCYRSQFAALDGGPVRRITNPAVLGHEVRWGG